MRLLLDTHAFLWWVADDRRLVAAAREAIASPDSVVHVSAASCWEASIKAALGRLEVGGAHLDLEIAGNDFVELPVTARHGWRAGQLPPHHQDPFDRLLIAQAQSEHLTIVTRDRAFASYDVRVLQA